MFPFSQCTLSDYYYYLFIFFAVLHPYQKPLTHHLQLIVQNTLWIFSFLHIHFLHRQQRGYNLTLFTMSWWHWGLGKHSKYTLTRQFVRKTCTSACPCNYPVSQSCGSRVIGSCGFRSRIQVGTDSQKLDKHQRQTLLNSSVRTWTRSNVRFVFLPDRRETRCGLPLL